MSDSEQYTEKCGHCNCTLTENVHIYVLAKGIKEQTWCADCVQTFWQDLKSDGWTADDETWSELGFDDGEDKPDADPHYAACSSRNGDKCNCGAESEADKPDPCEDCGVEAFWIKKFDRWSVVDNLCPNCSLKAEQDD